MVAGFRRSVSLPRPKTSAGSPAKGGPPALDKSYHVRSTSLPCRSHPLVSQLEDEVRTTRTWQSSAELAGPPSSAWLRSGLIRLELLHLALDDLLRLPQTADSLRRSNGADSSCLAERLLDDFLCFADAYGTFRSALVRLQELQSAAQVAVRRRDGARLASVARSLREAEKEVAALALPLREASRLAEPALLAAPSGRSAAYVLLAGMLREVESVTVSVSAAVFQGTAAALSSATAAVAPKSSCWRALRRRLAPTRPAAFSSKKKRASDEETTEEEREWTRRAFSGRVSCSFVLLVLLETQLT
ncbi:hypothetical protein Taro_027686 [Colocasia esculenta]|uniref:Uncharacterized protein n=1 Tax=Colocasia esculenta TaxID=4460 RepID=A0A843VEI7_COLES|nr:hypothetical protein [Colocasia esculenta]